MLESFESKYLNQTYTVIIEFHKKRLYTLFMIEIIIWHCCYMKLDLNES